MQSQLAAAYDAAVAAGGVAIIEGERVVTWADIDRSARTHARFLLERELTPPARVAVMASPVDAIAATFAHLRMGMVSVPINHRYTGDEVEYVVGHAGASALVTSISGAPIEAWGAAPDEDAMAMFVYTSGTTGRPKGVIQTHRSLAANIGAVMRLWEVGPEDVLSLALPLFHVHGLGLGVLGALLLSHATLRLHAKFAADLVIDDFRAAEYRSTVFMGVPTMYHLLLHHLDGRPADREPLRAARLFTAGSAALSARDFERFRAHTGHAILERYGMTETGFTLSNPYRGERRPGSVGLPVPGVEVRLAEGEIQVRGDCLMDGYWQDHAATDASTTADGWFKTGDIAVLDPAGYYRIIGRASTDVIKSGGFKIGAREIEDVLIEDGRFAELAVIGVADDKWGEVVAVVVVAGSGVELPDAATLLGELQAFAAKHLADYKWPRALRVVTALPKNAMGKVQKVRLRDYFVS